MPGKKGDASLHPAPTSHRLYTPCTHSHFAPHVRTGSEDRQHVRTYISMTFPNAECEACRLSSERACLTDEGRRRSLPKLIDLIVARTE